MKEYIYPEFVVKNVSYGYILTDHQAEKFDDYIKTKMTRIPSRNLMLRMGLWISRAITVRDLFLILEMDIRKYDTALPKSWTDAHRDEYERTPCGYWYGDPAYPDGRIMKPFEELYPQVVEMIVSTWNQWFDDLTEKR